MRINFLIIFPILSVLFSCNSDSVEPKKDVNLAPTVFNVTLEEITDISATIKWTVSNDPENQNITYDIYLDNNLIDDNLNNLNYTFENLLSETNYSGKVVASDGVNSTNANFSFKTQPFVPLIFNGSVVLSTQQEVNDFGNNHYNIINGNLSIQSITGPTSDISDLNPLLDLTEVIGYVQIQQTSLQSLEGLNNLSTINEYLRIDYNDTLQNLNGLESLDSINQDLLIYNNNLLENTNTIGNLNNFSGYIKVSNNPSLINLTFSNKIKQLKSIEIYDNASLEGISGLNNITKIDDFLFLNDNKSLSNIDFSSLIDIGGSLSIVNNLLTDMSAFNNLSTIGGLFEVMSNTSLTSLNGLSNLTSVNKTFNIWNNYMLSDYCSLAAIVQNNGISGTFSTIGNLFNPTEQNIIDGNCNQ